MKYQMVTAMFGGMLCSLLLLTGGCDASTAYCKHNYTISILHCKEDDKLCWGLVGVGGVVILLLIILTASCVVVTCLMAKGMRYMIKHCPISFVTSEQRDIEQNQHQTRNRGSQEANAVCTQADPQYDTVDETGPSHYFELEPPGEVSSRVTISGSSSSKPYSLPELATAQTTGATYNELKGPGHCKGLKNSTTSIPQATPQYNSISTENIPEQEKPKELIPIYSMPDKRKKTKAQQKAKEKKERESEMSRSRTLDSLFNTKSQNIPEQGTDMISDEHEIIQRTLSPPPPMLPPKPGQKIAQVEEDTQNAKNEESVYSEVSSKPLQDDTPRKDHTQQFALRTTTTAISPLHANPKKSSPYVRDSDDIPRSFSTLDNAQHRGTHSQKPTDPLQRQLYNMPIDLFLSYGEVDRTAQQN